MSGDEFEESEAFDEELIGEAGGYGDNVSEERKMYLRGFCSAVRPKPPLYSKRTKGYSKTIDILDMLKVIGTSLTPAMTGEEARSLFYKLRQKFGKERRQVLRSMRSGAGGGDVYEPKWFLYKDLMFLADTIQPRQTSSNFKRKRSPSRPISVASCSSSRASTTPPLMSPNSNDSVWSTNIMLELSDSDCMSPPPLSGPPPPPKKTVPPSDIVGKRKRESDKASDAIEKTARSVETGIEKNCGVMTALVNRPSATTAAAVAPAPPENALPPMISGMLETIKGAILQAPGDQQLACTIQVLQVIQSFQK